MEQAHHVTSFAQAREHLAEGSRTRMPSSVHHYTQVSERPLSSMKETQQSAMINWRTSDVHRQGGLAGYGAMTRKTLADPGF